MSNASIASRILEVVLAFESGKASSYLVNESIELHISALEGIPRDELDQLGQLGLKLLKGDLSAIEREQMGWPDTTTETVSKIKAILIKLGALA